jgi:hypothetical protein
MTQPRWCLNSLYSDDAQIDKMRAMNIGLHPSKEREGGVLAQVYCTSQVLPDGCGRLRVVSACCTDAPESSSKDL